MPEKPAVFWFATDVVLWELWDQFFSMLHRLDFLLVCCVKNCAAACRDALTKNQKIFWCRASVRDGAVETGRRKEEEDGGAFR